jgi:hypothetical protein
MSNRHARDIALINPISKDLIFLGTTTIIINTINVIFAIVF